MKYKLLIMCAVFATLLFSVEINVGDNIESFMSKDDTGLMWHSDSTDADYLVVYFYPAAMTFGCTKQACSYRDLKSEFMDLNAEILGVSGDEVEALQVFKKAHNLNFTLLSDSKGLVAKTFGVPISDGGEIKKKIDGQQFVLKRGVTTKRWTFVVDKTGKILYKNNGVNPLSDAKNVLKELQK